MPPVKDEESSARPVNTTAQIQQIFSEIQSQLPSVNFDNDDQNTDDNDNEELLESSIPDNTDAFLESLSYNTNSNSFLTLHPRIETPQQPPSVELQMRVSPNLFDSSLQNQDSPPKPSFLSMDLFNSIDFEKLPSLASNQERSQPPNVTQTFSRPRPNNQRNTSTQQQQVNIKSRDDRQILERLAQQANQFYTNERSLPTREHNPFRNLESALSASSNQNFDRHAKRSGVPESERKTVFIDLRNSNVQKQEKPSNEQKPINTVQPISQRIQPPLPSSSDSESDDDGRNDGMLWFEKRKQAKQQQQQTKASEQ